MIHPTRTNLLLTREKSRSVVNSVAILHARHQALMREFLALSAPFLQSRDTVQATYGRAMDEMHLGLGRDGEEAIASLVAVTPPDLGVEIAERSVMGVRYQEVTVPESAVRPPDRRGYDYQATTPHLEEAIQLHEEIVEALLAIAVFESKMKRLGDEIVRIGRRIRVLEERILPDLRRQSRAIAHYLGEREREDFYRLKRFKGGRQRR